METRSIVRGVRLSADKGRLVADMVRGKKVDQALNILTFTPKKAAGIIKKPESKNPLYHLRGRIRAPLCSEAPGGGSRERRPRRGSAPVGRRAVLAGAAAVCRGGARGVGAGAGGAPLDRAAHHGDAPRRAGVE